MASPVTDRAQPQLEGVTPASPFRRLVGVVGATNLGLIVALFVLIVFISLRTPFFLSAADFLTIALAVSLLGILAISQTVVIISGGLDISVGSTAGLASVTAAIAVGATSSAAAGIGAGIAIGAVAGLINGLII